MSVERGVDDIKRHRAAVDKLLAMHQRNQTTIIGNHNGKLGNQTTIIGNHNGKLGNQTTIIGNHNGKLDSLTDGLAGKLAD